jgi:hypothetical protein
MNWSKTLISQIYYSDQKESYKNKILEAKKENARLLNRIANSEEDVKELEEALQNGIQVLCKIL